MKQQDRKSKEATKQDEKADEPEPVRRLFLLRQLRDAGKRLKLSNLIKNSKVRVASVAPFHVH